MATRPQLANKIKTDKDIENRLIKISGYSKDVIFAMTVSQLRELGAFLIKDARKKKHDELAQSIYDAGQAFIQRRKLEISSKTVVSAEFNELESILFNAFIKHKDVNTLVEDLAYDWKNIKNYADSTIASTKPKELRLAIEKIKYEIKESSEFFDEFYQTFYKIVIKPIKDEINQSYGQKINTIETIEDKIKLDGEIILNWAINKIKTVLQLPNSKIQLGWYDLSLALAITSGRRMEEIHGETIHISKGIKRYYSLDGKEVFISQLAKSPENTNFKFTPIGVSSEDWFNAFNKLPDNALSLTEDKVNKIISTNISKSLKGKGKTYDLLGISCYKDSRDFYIAYRVANEYKKGITKYNNESDFVQSIIGHDNKGSGHSYQKFVIV